jgi:lipoprotein-anchoring transpeptidase ErfK/SrfK
MAIALAAFLAVQAHSQKRHGSADRTVQPRAALSAEQVNNADQPQIGLGAKGAGVARAQILLARVHFSCGEIDGSFGSNLQTAVRAFQQDRGLPVTGAVDAATWNALAGDTAPAIDQASIDPADTQGPFTEIPSDIEKQASLPALGYTSALEAIAERFHSSPTLIKALNPGVDFTQEGQQLSVPNVLVMAPGAAARIVVSRGESSVRALDGAGKLLAFYIATTGSDHDPLPIGEWKVLGVAHNPKFHYNPELFWDAKKTSDHATIQPGPNNPVGVVWIDLSKDHYGIHGTPEPSQVGHAYSHGCIRLTNWDAAELAGMVKPGTPATLQE